MNRKNNYFSKKSVIKEISILGLLIIFYILIRSIHFASYINFSHDQGLFSSRAIEIYRNKSLTLIGPSISYIFQGREIFQGGVIYYVFLLFLWLGNFEPLMASYFFMLFSAVMLIPLFYGVKLLMNKNAAWLVCIIYTFLPFYINYSRFLWNPNFQFSLLPILILFMGLFKKYNKVYLFGLMSIFLGILLQFHYQFIVIIIGIAIYYFVLKQTKLSFLPVYTIGLMIGLSPLILFELRNNFYNLQTIYFFLSHGQYFLNSGGSMQSHYFLSISFFVLLFFVSVVQKYFSEIKLIVLTVILLSISVFIYGRKPLNAFGMSDNWNYISEESAFRLIKAQKISNFNVANTIYDTKASVQKYLLRRDAVIINEEDYYNNKYLFVISTNKDTFTGKRAYEIETFKPSVIVSNWKINDYYKLYLLKRIGRDD